MDRRFDPEPAAIDHDRPGPREYSAEPVLPSRREALDELRRAIRRSRGPILLTGEAGAGKTWLWRHLAEEGGEPLRWLGIDVASSDDGLDLLRRVIRGLGVGRDTVAAQSDLRSALADELAEQSEEGRRWVLVLDEAQNAADQALEESLLLTNRLGRPEGFAGLLFVGRTGLGMRLRTRRWESLDARLAALVALGPIDAEEAEELLHGAFPDQAWNGSQVEALHAKAAGNPARLISLADRLAFQLNPSPDPSPLPSPKPSWRPSPANPGPSRETAASGSPPPQSPGDQAASLIEDRPPLRFEEGLIEVGWPSDDAGSPDLIEAPGAGAEALEGELTESFSANGQHPGKAPTAPIGPSTEPIDDPYAAIQARSEWSLAARTAGLPVEPPAPGEPSPTEPQHVFTAETADRARSPMPNVRAEAGQEFAPYSRLFSQLNSSSDTE